MNNSIKFLLGAGVASLIYGFLNRKKAALENLKIQNIDVYIDKEKSAANFYLKLFYNIKLNLYNSASVKVNIKSVEAKFYLNGIKFGTLNSNVNTIIEAQSLKDLTLGASVNSADVIASILDIISEEKAEITVVGSLLTDLGLITFKETKAA
jgi:LEA14-like dessication related protein